MISVAKDFANAPANLLSQKCQDLITDAISHVGKHKFQKEYYAGKENEDSSKKNLIALYNNKCCFCESNASPSSFWQVEHFRPKNKSPKKSKYGHHNGYYWLGYEWSNLLLICSKCNNKKNSHFPLLNSENRIKNHPLDANNSLISNITNSIYENEGCILLNPEIDKVEDFLIFKPNGDIKGIDTQGRGEISIELYHLRRENLILARRKISDDFFDEIKSILADYLTGDIPEQSLIHLLNVKFRTLTKKINPKIEYSRVWNFLFNKFHIFAKHHLPNQQDFDLVMRRFKIFLEEN